MHNESEFISNIQNLEKYIPKIQNKNIKNLVEKFVNSVINDKNYKLFIFTIAKNHQKQQKEEFIKQNRLKVIESIYTSLFNGDIEEACTVFNSNYSDIQIFNPIYFSKLSSKIKIAQFLKYRKIEKLVHFTNIENLSSILKIGLLPRKTLEEQNINFVYSDESRLEGRKDCICLSVEYPNSKMLYYKKNRDGCKYVVLVLNAQKILLNDLKKYYVYINAASSKAIYWLKTEELTTLKYLKNMFSERVQDSRNIYEREDKDPDFIPTNPQAEILVNGVVDVNDIIEVHFANSEDYDIFKNICNNDYFLINKTKFIVNDFYFNKDRNNVVWEDR